jgi:hypothetical protein
MALLLRFHSQLSFCFHTYCLGLGPRREKKFDEPRAVNPKKRRKKEKKNYCSAAIGVSTVLPEQWEAGTNKDMHK